MSLPRKEEDVTASVIVNSNVDASKIGLYSVSYSAANADGFSSSAKRTVIVYDPAITTNASGSYTVDASVSYQDMNVAQAPFKGSFKVYRWIKVAPGIFAISISWVDGMESRCGLWCVIC